MSGFFNEIFGGSDAVDEAGDAQQARIVQAIDLFNDRFEQAVAEKRLGTDNYVTDIRKTIAQMKSELAAGNAEAAEKLKSGLDDQVALLERTYNFQKGELTEFYETIEGKLGTAEAEATAELTTARDLARTDLTAGSDAALSTLRSSLTKSLDAISSGTDKASQEIKSSLDRTRQTYAPYIQAGSKAITRAEQLTNDPEAQLAYVQDNPFYAAMQETARDNLFANQAAKGRLGTGGTLDELDKRTLLLGEQLVGNAVNRNTAISSQGLNAANNQVGSDTNLTNILANILNSSGIAGAGLQENFAGRTAGIQAGTGEALANLETRYGENVAGQTNNAANAMAEIGANFGGMLGNSISNYGMAATSATGNYWNALAALAQSGAADQAGLTGQGGFAEAGAEAGFSDFRSGGILNGAGVIGDYLLQLGNSESGEAIGEYNAEMQGLNTLINIAALVAGFPPVGGNQGGTPMNSVGPMSGGYAGATGGTHPYYATPTAPIGGQIWNPPSFFNPTPYTPFSVGGNN